ncbi:NUDIX domain-containing protein [Exiguobacterium sp. 17-1]|uniref:NUDIX domain-containing protein n=1 Tax=Exiguobacterium sp. 17-1 TaxID=2931981 RepID=UPI001FFEFD09|nr:NUDIX domain-containing protein [Exiguobacterium sp. 17-1]MCK2158638.1 NUDIX domain-containing protein [Exiguobacterium sp. 17-1]
MRHRACAALIENGRILMVRIITENQSFWTLPGGGLNTDETFEQAVVREVAEEVRLTVRVIRPLYTKTDSSGKEVCFLVKRVDATIPLLGHDPERPLDQQVLSGIDWHPLAEMKEDIQVAEVLAALNKTPSLLL